MNNDEYVGASLSSRLRAVQRDLSATGDTNADLWSLLGEAAAALERKGPEKEPYFVDGRALGDPLPDRPPQRDRPLNDFSGLGRIADRPSRSFEEPAPTYIGDLTLRIARFYEEEETSLLDTHAADMAALATPQGVQKLRNALDEWEAKAVMVDEAPIRQRMTNEVDAAYGGARAPGKTGMTAGLGDEGDKPHDIAYRLLFVRKALFFHTLSSEMREELTSLLQTCEVLIGRMGLGHLRTVADLDNERILPLRQDLWHAALKNQVELRNQAAGLRSKLYISEGRVDSLKRSLVSTNRTLQDLRSAYLSQGVQLETAFRIQEDQRQKLEEVHRYEKVLEDRCDSLAPQLEAAWGIIANVSGGDWDRQGIAWQGAARRWRDRYAGLADGVAPQGSRPRPELPENDRRAELE